MKLQSANHKVLEYEPALSGKDVWILCLLKNPVTGHFSIIFTYAKWNVIDGRDFLWYHPSTWI